MGLGEDREHLVLGGSRVVESRDCDRGLLVPLQRRVQQAWDETHRLPGPRPQRGASLAVLGKLGFVEEGRQRQSVCVRGRCMDMILFGLLRAELVPRDRIRGDHPR